MFISIMVADRYRASFRTQVIVTALIYLVVEKGASQDCGTPPYLLNGAYTLPSGTTLSGAVAVYTCNVGYGIVGSANVACLNTGAWDNLPSCSKDCGSPTSIENGNFVPPSSMLQDSEVVYSCNPGYTMVGGAAVVCQSTGHWSSAPGCQIVLSEFNESCFTSEACLTIGATCRADHSGEDRCLCAATGEVYDVSMDTCLADCGLLSHPTNGWVTLAEKTSERQVAVYTCILGFTLSDVTLATRTCLSTGEWSLTAPQCIVAIVCDCTARFVSHVVGNPENRFYHDAAQCTLSTTGCVKPPPPVHGYLNDSYNRAAGDTIHYGCDMGYMLVGVNSRVCRDDTTWSGNEPLCLIECPILDAIEDGSVDISNGYWQDSIATYICNKDYALVGSSTRVCKSTGEWSGFPPTCIFGFDPNALLVCSCLLLVVVLINVLTIAFFFYLNKKRRTWDSIPSDEPSETYKDWHEPAGEPAGEASGEPSGEPAEDSSGKPLGEPEQRERLC